MTEHIQIGDVSPRINYIGDGSTVAFSYSFPIFVDTDIEVYIDGALQTLTTHYAVSGAGNSAGGTVTFTTAPTNGADILFVRRLTIARTSDFEDAGLFRGNRINDDFDFQMAAIQQVADDQSRSISLAHTDAAANLKLPEKSSRASKQLGFDGNGDVSLSSPFTSDHSARDMAASALAYAMESNNAQSINGAVGPFYLVDDFEADNLAVATNATHDATGGYYASRPGVTASDTDDCSSITGWSKVSQTSWTSETTLTVSSGSIRAGTNSQGIWFGASSPSYTAPSGDVIRWRVEFFSNHNASSAGAQYQEFFFGVPHVSKHIRINGNEINGNASHTFEVASGQWYVLEVEYNELTDETTVIVDGVTLCSGLAAISGAGTFYDGTVQAGGFMMIGGTAGGASFQGHYLLVRDIQVGIFETPDITLAPSAVTLATVNPKDVIAYAVIDPQEQITIGTDIVMTFSIDGGTTHATGSWTKVGNLGPAGLELYRVDADVSAQSGSSLTYEITTFNNKHIRVHEIVGLIPTY